MEVRSYYATTVEAAIEMARRELGPDAMLIHSKRTTPEQAHLGRYEVVLAGEDPVPQSSARQPFLEPAAPAATPRRPQPDLDTAGLGPVDLVGKLDFATVLRSAGVSPEMSNEFFTGRRSAPGPSTADTIALVGAPGCGKTSVLMKLALARGLQISRAVRIFSYDPERVGGTHQLRHFAAIFGISFAGFETPEEMCLALTHRFDGLTLIDTAGFSRSETSALASLARSLREQAGVEIHLVLRADRKTADNLAAIDRFAPFAPARLIFSALDETSDSGDLHTLIGRAAIPVSFLATGPQIDDFEQASTTRLADLARNDLPRASRAAA